MKEEGRRKKEEGRRGGVSSSFILILHPFVHRG
jgi:hypothetical protein